MYLCLAFPDFDVDVEYNRHGVDPKRLPDLEACGGDGDRLVYPDLIVHRRGDDGRNLLAVELKKSSNPTPRDCDLAKLRGLIEDYGYSYCALVTVPVADKAGEPFEVEWPRRFVGPADGA